jgi:hypothetical protein
LLELGRDTTGDAAHHEEIIIEPGAGASQETAADDFLFDVVYTPSLD